VRALQLEMCYSKRELLEAHLNLMPYGGNIQGIGTASLIYFGKQPRRLGLAESLALVLIPQSPARRAPTHDEPRELRAGRERLFERWVAAHPEARALTAHMAMPLEFGSIRDLPFNAPHFTDHVLHLQRSRAAVQSTLDLPLQRVAERVVTNYLREQRAIGVDNASVLLVDYRDMSVRAMVGSANFFSASISGQVNGTLAKRSPGSTLKPFIYALAIDQGLIHPLTVLKDAPTSFGAYSPENFDGRFVGPITATEALIRSRNVPAVALSAQLAQPSLYQFLKGAGVSQLASEQHYGLALTLGGGEITMEEGAMLYAMLANRGRLAPLRYFADEPQASGPRLLSEEASFMTLDMLQSAPRPQDSFAQPRAGRSAAWKTGTSWGFRDAWT
ncbi:MAG: penicillin-binding transpeptidase domain-containing protein, partial [Steroidobacteraceae bacterium]